MVSEGPPHTWDDKTVFDLSALEADVAKLIVQTLNLNIEPLQIQPEQPLFNEGLGLDSIDALELSLVISQCYGYKIRSDDPETVATFASLRSLCQSIEKHRTK
jgi:acyl carrier protein